MADNSIDGDLMTFADFDVRSLRVYIEGLREGRVPKTAVSCPDAVALVLQMLCAFLRS